jgi:hypothetical protein
VLAIENCLLKNLSAIFSPTLTANMDDEQLFAIAAESEEIRLERTLLRAKLDSLQSGKNILYKHIGKADTLVDIQRCSNSFASNETYNSCEETIARDPTNC